MEDQVPVAPTPENWNAYVAEHTFTDNPYHNVEILLNRMRHIQSMSHCPDRLEYARQLQALEDIAVEFQVRTKFKKRFRHV